MNLQEKYTFAQEKLKQFKNYLEIADLRKFVLLILNLEGSGPDAILKQLGMGGKGKTILPYDPERKAYFMKIMSGLSMTHQLTIYHKSDKIHAGFMNKSDSALFTKTLTPFERKNLLPNKFAVIIPELYDSSEKILTNGNAPKPMLSAIEAIYNDLAEFIVTQGLKYLFLVEGKKNEPDLVFTMSMSMEMSQSAPNQIQYFEVYVDEEKKLRGHTFIRMADDDEKPSLDLVVLDEIKEAGHAELYNSHYTIIVPVKSFALL